MTDLDQDYFEVYGKYPDPWRIPLGALRLTLHDRPTEDNFMRAQRECEELVRVLNEVMK